MIGFIVFLIGVFIVVRWLLFIVDVLSYVILGGIFFGMFLFIIMLILVFINLMWFGILFVIVGVFLIEKLRMLYIVY